jgi:hypothetical protein
MTFRSRQVEIGMESAIRILSVQCPETTGQVIGLVPVEEEQLSETREFDTTVPWADPRQSTL